MIKNRVISILILSACSTQLLIADDFNQFLNKAIEKSPYLQSSVIGVEQSKYRGSIEERYENPSFDVGYSIYKPELETNDNGYSISLSQPVKLWGVLDDKKRLSKAIIQNAKNEYTLDKSTFIRDISIYYTVYAEEKSLVNLGVESLSIARRIYDIAKERYNVGSISQADTLQSETTLMEIQIQNENLKISSQMSYYDLLKFAGIEEKINLNETYVFSIKQVDNISNNPTLLSIKNKIDIALAEEKVFSNSIESIDVVASYEKEPDQTVSSVGLSIPLTIFNDKSQEKAISRLEAKKMNFLLKNEEIRLDNEYQKLLEQRGALEKLKEKTQRLLLLKNELLDMYLEKYKVSQSSLLELQNIKNQVVGIKRDLIKINTALNQNAIYLNYIQGVYNV